MSTSLLFVGMLTAHAQGNDPVKIVMNISPTVIAVGSPVSVFARSVKQNGDPAPRFGTSTTDIQIKVQIDAAHFKSGPSGTIIIQTTDAPALAAGTYQVTASQVGTGTPLLAPDPIPITIVAIDKLIIDGSNPENEGPGYTAVGSPLTLRAKPTPAASPFPAGNPIWTITEKPAGSMVANPAVGIATASINPDKIGKYVIKAVCGTSEKIFTLYALSVVFTEDTSQSYGFDDYTDANVPWKSVESGNKLDSAKANITPSAAFGGTYFKSSDAAKMTVSPSPANAALQTVTITGIARGEADANAKANADTGPTVGTMKVAVYQQVSKSVAVRLVHEENDDMQDIAVGKGKSNTICITGAGGILHSTKAGDDVIVGANITTGPDGICNSTAAGGDAQTILVGKGKANEVCVSSGTNAFRDTPNPVGSDDAVVGNNITTGPDGICNTTAKRTNVNSTDVTDAEITAYLKKVYSQAVFKWEFHRLSAKSVNFDLNRDGKLDDATWMTPEMAAIRDGAKDDLKDNNIFLVNNPITGGLGFMDVGQRYGYVHADKSNHDANTISHELGHGAFSLEHPDQQIPADNDINNLMHSDEAEPWRLRKNQWDIINPL